MKRLLVALSLTGAGVVAAGPSFALTKADEIGQPGNPALADRALRVSAAADDLNVQRGETVNLYANGQRVTWNFSGLEPVVSLQDIARGAPDVDVYVSEPNES